MTTTTAAWTANDRDHNWSSPDQDDAALNFHRTLNGYEPTALTPLPELARELGVAAVFAKDESTRLGMPAFKALGASWPSTVPLRLRRRTPTPRWSPPRMETTVVP